MQNEILRLHIALLCLLTSVIIGVYVGSVVIWQLSQGFFNPWYWQWLVYTLLPATLLCVADSIWDLGKKRPASRFRGGYIWLAPLVFAAPIVSLVWIFRSYPGSLSGIRIRNPMSDTGSAQTDRLRIKVIGAYKMGNQTLCPYCLLKDSIKAVSKNGSQIYTCSNPACPTIPLEYANNPKVPRNVVSAVGFLGHGKTVYFASLFYELNELANYWNNFFTFAIDEKSLDTIKENAKMLKAAHLPEMTPMNFTQPTIVRFCKMPSFGDMFFLFYDISGEAFQRSSHLIKHAKFVSRSRTVLFIISLSDLDEEKEKIKNGKPGETYTMNDLLSTYVTGLAGLQGNTKHQHLIIVLSKADKLKAKFEKYPDIWNYLEEGGIDRLGNMKIQDHIKEMKQVSQSLKRFMKQELREGQFLNFAENRFKSVEFSIVSALGAEPDGGSLRQELLPKCILDPLLWVAIK